MKLITLVTLALLAFCSNTRGQDSLHYQGQHFRMRDMSSKTKIEPPLVIIKSDGKTCNVPATGRLSNSRQVKRAFKKFNPDLVQAIDVIKGKDATEKYGTAGQYGVIIITMKNNTYGELPKRIRKGCG